VRVDELFIDGRVASAFRVTVVNNVAKLQHQVYNYTACAEQRSSDRSPGAKTIPRQPVVEDVTLAARSAGDRLQSGSADVQSPQHVHAGVPSSLNSGSTTPP